MVTRENHCRLLFGAFDTTYLETPQLVTLEECIKMIQYKTCDGNQMSVSGHASSFNFPPKGEGSWMTTQAHKILNCEIEEFNVTQDCTNCPIKSPFGILNLNPQSNNDHTTMQKDNRKSRSP